MIQYIVAAGLGALIGSAQKGKKKYKKKPFQTLNRDMRKTDF